MFIAGYIGSGCKPSVQMLWVEAGTFVTDDKFPIIQSMQQLKIAIRRKPAAGGKGK
jgi:hypothetical protein